MTTGRINQVAIGQLNTVVIEGPFHPRAKLRRPGSDFNQEQRCHATDNTQNSRLARPRSRASYSARGQPLSLHYREQKGLVPTCPYQIARPDTRYRAGHLRTQSGQYQKHQTGPTLILGTLWAHQQMSTRCPALPDSRKRRGQAGTQLPFPKHLGNSQIGGSLIVGYSSVFTSLLASNCSPHIYRTYPCSYPRPALHSAFSKVFPGNSEFPCLYFQKMGL